MSQASWIIDQLICQGATHFCIAPGSRSTPLAIAVAERKHLFVKIHYDERGLGFYALGIGKGAKFPAVVIATSGTAVANLFPAIMEAFHSYTPLIILTADRPQELRLCGANQTADQTKIFANAIRFQIELSPHLEEKATQSIIAQSVAMSLRPPQGPVHINCPFQEPFALHAPISIPQKITYSYPQLAAPPIIRKEAKGVILLGKTKDPKPALDLAKKIQWPIFIDLLSSARSENHQEQICHFDFLVRNPHLPKPELILHMGERMMSKHVLAWRKNIPTIHVSPLPDLQDPDRNILHHVQSDIAPFCETFQADTDDNWLQIWKAWDASMHEIIEEHFGASCFTEAHAIRNLPQHLPLYFGNSMPIRYADQFFFPTSSAPIFANRGVSGIDGNIATIAGIAKTQKTKLIAFIGDQTALHDLNSLPLLRNENLLLCISNNFGGGIFHHLPIAKSPFLDPFFTASHTWNFEGVAQMFQIPYARQEKTEPLPESGIVEILTNREESLAFHQSLLQKTACLLCSSTAF